MDPLVTMQSALIVITMTAGGVCVAAILGEDVVFSRPSSQVEKSCRILYLSYEI